MGQFLLYHQLLQHISSLASGVSNDGGDDQFYHAIIVITGKTKTSSTENVLPFLIPGQMFIIQLCLSSLILKKEKEIP